MMKTQRTPVKTTSDDSDDIKNSSQGDSGKKSHKSPMEIVQSNKRRRTDKNCCSIMSFKVEIQEMFSQWKLELNDTLSKMQGDLSDVKQKTDEIKNTNLEIEKSLDFLSTKYDDLTSKIDTLEGIVHDNRQYILTLESNLEELNRRSCSEKLEIRNIPYSHTESLNDLTKMVDQLMKTINMDISPQDIINIQRIVGKKTDSLNPVLITLSTILLKNKILNAIKTYNKNNTSNKINTTHIGIEGPPKPIYVVEHLTTKARRLYYLGRQLVKSKLYKFCWTANGRVYLRKEEGSKLIIITEESQINVLKQALDK